MWYDDVKEIISYILIAEKEHALYIHSMVILLCKICVETETLDAGFEFSGLDMY